MEIKLQLFHQVVEVSRVEGNHVLGDPIVVARLTTMYSLQQPHCCCRLTLESVANVISVGTSAVLKEVLTRLRLPRQVLQILQLVDARPKMPILVNNSSDGDKNKSE